MRRRRILHTAAVTLPLLGGCLAQPPGTGALGASQASGRVLTIEHVETFSHALRLNDLGDSPAGTITPFTSLSDRQQRVVRAAIEDAQRSSDPPRWLIEFATSTPHVQKDGAYYRLENTFPTYRITATAVEESAVDGRIATYDAYEEAVTSEMGVASGLMRVAQQEGYEVSLLRLKLRNFLETYDAVDYHGDILDFALTVDDPGPPYTITATRVTPSGLTDAPVWDATDAPGELRSIVRASGQRGGVYPIDDPPAELIAKLDANEYVYLDGTFYTTYVEKRAALPVSLSASFVDSTLDESGGEIQLTLENESDRPIEVMSGAPKPFGVLSFHPAGDTEASLTLWSDTYEESQYVSTVGHRVTAIAAIGLTSTIQPGGSIDRTFTIEQTDLAPGEYVIEDNVEITLDDDSGGTFPYRVVFRVKEPAE